MKKYILRGLAVLIFLFSIAPVSSATPEYARQTGLACGKCHIDPSGGGPLTAEGRRFLAGLKLQGHYWPLPVLEKAVHVFVGYIHLLTAILWFGTVLYVHVLLKPAYAAKGLPRGELLLGWVSIVIMAVTGSILTIERMPSWTSFYTTRFGILLCVKIFLFLVMTATAAVVTLYIRPRMKEKRKGSSPGHPAEKQDFTLEELRAFDGRDGRPAYVGYNGVVYDVTDSRLWKRGSHLRKHSAGSDLTEVLKTAPHGEEKILSMKRTGRLKAETSELRRPFYERLFYFFAYMNLAIVFLIVFVVALMRWG
jgi:predicted heme/steroid binding protein/uncharacterized membrane protein